VPPGISDAIVPNPVFNLTAAATVDEGNNWINISWGPLTLSHPVTGAILGNYALLPASPSIDRIPCANTVGGCQAAGGLGHAPLTDFFGNPRPDPDVDGRIDVGAVEFQHSPVGASVPTLTSIVPNGGSQGRAVGVVLTGTNLTGGTLVVSPPTGIAVSGVTVTPTTVTATFTIAANAPATARLVSVTTAAGVSNALTFTVAAPSGTLAPSPLTFGFQALTTTSAPQTVTFTNTTGFPIALRSGTNPGVGNANGPAVALTGGNANNFAIAAGTTCTNGLVIANGGQCFINITFTPNVLTPRTTTLRVYAAGATASFVSDAVSGGGAIVAFSGPTALTSFPATRTAKSVLTTITNTGNVPLVISNIAFTSTSGTNPGTFSVASPGTLGTRPCPIGGAGLAPGFANRCQVTVTYTPPAAGALNTITGTLTVTDTGAATASQSRNYTGN
jgi:hypothetical protein